MAKQIQRMDLSAAPGNPSTLWRSESGKYYRKLKEAQEDKGQTVNPDDYEIKTPVIKRLWKKYSSPLIISVIVAAAVICYFKLHK